MTISIKKGDVKMASYLSIDDQTLEMALSRTAEGREILRRLSDASGHLMGDDEMMGKFLPGLMNALRSVGKVTSKITGAIAKAVLPDSLVDALAKIDPTTHTALLDKMADASSKAQAAVAAALPSDTTAKPVQTAGMFSGNNMMILYLAGGAIVFLLYNSLNKKRGKRRYR